MATDMNIDDGYFVSTGESVIIPCRSNFDYFEIMNYTPMATTATPGRIVRASWQRGFAADYALTSTKTNATNAINETIATSGGFTLVNTSIPVANAAVAYGGATNGSPVVVSTGSTAGLVAGDIVRMYNPLNYQLAGMDFTIGTIVTNTSFRLPYMDLPGDAAPGAGTYRKVGDVGLYKPRKRFITEITLGNTTLVQMSVQNAYFVGEKVNLLVPVEYGTIELNNLRGTILSIDDTTNEIELDINSSGFSAFTFPRATDVPFTFAQVIPNGEIPILISSATANDSVLGIKLGSAVCGVEGDEIYWKGHKAFRYSTSIPLTS